MEDKLNKVFNEITSNENVYGCIVVDHQGLSVKAVGAASPHSAGIIAAIANQAAKIEPNDVMPVITFETYQRKCIIQKSGTLTAAIYKKIDQFI